MGRGGQLCWLVRLGDESKIAREKFWEAGLKVGGASQQELKAAEEDMMGQGSTGWRSAHSRGSAELLNPLQPWGRGGSELGGLLSRVKGA